MTTFSRLTTAHRFFVLGAIAGLCTSAALAQIDPEKQKETDWVDSRWNQTDIGSFHAAVVSLPGDTFAKGLSIRLGTNAAVAYDTATATLRGGWTGGFLSFDSTRYGLMRPPKPAGDVQFVLKSG